MKKMIQFIKANPFGTVLVGVLLLLLFIVSIDRLDSLSGFAWPMVVVLVALIYKPAISKLLDRIRSMEGPGVKVGLDENAPAAPAAKALENQKGLGSLTDAAQWVLATLWRYQQDHDSGRWTFAVFPPDPDWQKFNDGVRELSYRGLIGTAPQTGQVFLSDTGFAFCGLNQDELAESARRQF